MGVRQPPGELRRNTVVTTNGQLIVAVEDDRGNFEENEQIVVEAPGCTLLPGLIDAHVHLCMDARDSPVARPTDTAELAIRGWKGTSDAPGRRHHRPLRRNAWERRPPSAQCVSRAQDPGSADRRRRPPIAMTGGHGHFMAIEADGVDAVMAAVRSQIKEGTDVKLMVTGGVLTPGADRHTSDAAGRDCRRGAGRSPGWSARCMPRS